MHKIAARFTLGYLTSLHRILPLHIFISDDLMTMNKELFPSLSEEQVLGNITVQTVYDTPLVMNWVMYGQPVPGDMVLKK